MTCCRPAPILPPAKTCGSRGALWLHPAITVKTAGSPPSCAKPTSAAATSPTMKEDSSACRSEGWRNAELWRAPRHNSDNSFVLETSLDRIMWHRHSCLCLHRSRLHIGPQARGCPVSCHPLRLLRRINEDGSKHLE